MVFYYSRKVTNIINLSVNDTNSPIKRCGPNDWIQKLETYCVFSLRKLNMDTHRVRIKEEFLDGTRNWMGLATELFGKGEGSYSQ